MTNLPNNANRSSNPSPLEKGKLESESISESDPSDDAKIGNADEVLREICYEFAEIAHQDILSEVPEDYVPFQEAAPRPAAEAHIEFLSGLTRDELLDVSIQLHAERDTLFRQLGKFSQQISETPPSSDDVVRVKEENEQLLQRIAELERLLEAEAEAEDGTPSYLLSAEAQSEQEAADQIEDDWESQKSQWLTRLQGMESGGGGAPSPSSARSQAKGSSSSTSGKPSSSPGKGDDGTLQRQKDRIMALEAELKTLRERLAEKTAADHLLDADELIQREREKLAQLQREWSDKIRESELQLSRERADISRAKVKLEEREATIKALQDRLERQQTTLEKSGGWRDMLGLQSKPKER